MQTKERTLLTKLGKIVRAQQKRGRPKYEETFGVGEQLETNDEVLTSECVAYGVIRYLFKNVSLEEALTSDEPCVRELAKKWSK